MIPPFPLTPEEISDKNTTIMESNGLFIVGNHEKRKKPVKVRIKEWFADLEEYIIETLLKELMNMVLINPDCIPSYMVMCYLLGDATGRIRCSKDTEEIDNTFKLIFDMCDDCAKADDDLPDDTFEFIKVGLLKYHSRLYALCEEAASHAD